MVRHILIVDSEINFSLPIKRALEGTGAYHVRTVTRLSSAIDALQENPFDLAIIDMRLEFNTPGQVIGALREMNPKLPIILSSTNEADSKHLLALGAQRFILKPYNARLLMPLLESTATEPLTPPASDTHAFLAEMEAREKEELIEPLLQATQQGMAAETDEPPIPNVDTTIAQVVEKAITPSVTQRIQEYNRFEPVAPDAPTVPSSRPPIREEPELSPEDTDALPATAALATTVGTASLDTLLEQIRTYASGEAAQPNDHPLSELVAQIEPPSPTSDTSGRIEPLPLNEDTHMAFIPPPTRLPDQEWLNSMDEVDTTVAPRVEISEEPLMPVTVEEITQQLVAVEEEVIEQAIEKEAETRRLPAHVVAHYALQLTQFAMESSSLGGAITRGAALLAQAGSLSQDEWQTVIRMITESWGVSGESRTRILYRQLARGEMLIYSIQTIEELILTLVFAAETPLKVIRRQAIRLSESLKAVPPPSDDVVFAEPPLAPRESEEPAAPREAPPPLAEDQREGSAAASAAPAETAPQESAAPPIELPAGTLTSYACAWMIENKRDAINPAAAVLLETWLREVCAAHDWRVETIQISSEWLYVAVQVPSTTLPSSIAATLMEETASRALALDPKQSQQSPWAKAYLIRTPPSSLQPREIERFVNFYRSAQIPA